MSHGLLTPRQLADHGVAVDISVPEYDWRRQQRWEDLGPVAGRTTGASIQTFDHKGKPSDSRSDTND